MRFRARRHWFRVDGRSICVKMYAVSKISGVGVAEALPSPCTVSSQAFKVRQRIAVKTFSDHVNRNALPARVIMRPTGVRSFFCKSCFLFENCDDLSLAGP